MSTFAQVWAHPDLHNQIMQNMHPTIHPPDGPPGGPSRPFLSEQPTGPQPDMSRGYARTRQQEEARDAHHARIRQILQSQDQRNRNGAFSSPTYPHYNFMPNHP